MEGLKFTWFPKLTSTVAKVPEGQRGLLLWALAQYGTYGTVPDLEWPLDAIFEGLREDIDNSKRSIRSGGRGGRKRAPQDGEPGCEREETAVADDANPPSGSGEPPSTDGAEGVGEDAKGGTGEAEPNPYQSIPIQSMPSQSKPSQGGRGAPFRRPTVEEVEAYAGEVGSPGFDARLFVDYYEASGWKVGRNPMRDWRATVRNWIRRDGPKGGGGFEKYDV